MNKATIAILALGLGLASMAVQPVGPALAQDQPIYGREMMTEQERLEFRERMRSATSDAERERIRLEHHELMQERARQQGVTLPDMPPAQGMGQRGGGRDGAGPRQGGGRR